MSQNQDSSSTGLRWFSNVIRELFAVDVRSLALLRIGLAIVILIDLINRFSTIDMLYTYQGILKDGDALAYLKPNNGFWSLYWIQGSAEFTRGLMVVNFLAAISLLVGFQTRVATVVCLILAWSLQICNPFVLTAGHVLLRMMLMWGAFLPLGAVWSVDIRQKHRSYRAKPDSWHVTSVASAGILLQLAFVYFFSGLSKLNPDWFSGQAVELAMNLEMYVKPFGQWMSEHTTVLRCITFATIGLEILLPILMFVPGISHFVRGASAAIFALMHIGIWSTMSIGIFSLVAIFSWVVFVPTESWNAWKGDPIGFGTERKSKWTPERWIGFGLATVLLLIVVSINIANMNPQKTSWLGRTMQRFSHHTMSMQEFKMFSELPKYSPWFEYRATLNNGDSIDIFSRDEYDAGEQPTSIYRQMKTQHWRRFHFNLINSEERQVMYAASSETGETVEAAGLEGDETLDRIRKNLLDQIVQEWDKGHAKEEKVAKAALIMHLNPIELASPVPAADGQQEQPRTARSFEWAMYAAE